MKRFFRWARGAGDDVQHEIEFYLEQRAKEFEARGLTPEAARRAAAEAFGDRAAIEREVRALRDDTVRVRRRNAWLEELGQDLRIAARGLRRTPAFTVVALATLALGIGANSAIFSVVRSVLLRPLPYAHPEQLVQLWSDHRAGGRAEPEWLAPPDFLEWREHNRTLTGMAAYQGWAPDLTGIGDPTSLAGLTVTGDFFPVLGATASLGRTLAAADDDPGAEPVVVLSDAVWRRHFGGDASIVGRQIQLSGQSWRVVGVLPPAFRPPVTLPVEVFRPMRRAPDSGCGRGCIVWRAIGRLKPGMTAAQAQGNLGAIAAQQASEYPRTNKGVGAWVVPLHEQITGPTQRPLLALSGAVLLVLLIACVNLANLLLTRGAGRARELGIRAALGAGRGRLVRQLLAESALLAVMGGVLGLALGAVGSRALGTVVPEDIRRIQEVRVDGVVIGFTAAVTLIAGALFGLLPSLQAAGPSLSSALKTGARATGRGAAAVRHALVSLELAFAVMLLVGAGLLLRSFLRMQDVDLGYRARGVLSAGVSLPASRYPAAGTPGVIAQLLDRLRADPGVRSAELTDVPPLSAGDQDVTAIAVGEPTAGGQGSIWYRSVSPGYLPLMRMRLVAGRQLGAADVKGAPLAGIVNEEAARRLWNGRNPVGRILALGRDSTAPRVTIVGVVASSRHDGPDQPYKMELFLPIEQIPTRNFAVVMEPSRAAAGAITALRGTLHELDPLLPLGRVDAVEDLVGTALALPRLYALLIGVFAGTALLLAVVGVYGVMAYAVAQRQQEIGVRLALGASPAGIRQLVLWQGGRLAAIGAVMGLIGAAVLGRLLGSLLFEVSAFDLPTFTAVPLVLATTAFVACWIPARRAMRVDPIVAIRKE